MVAVSEILAEKSNYSLRQFDAGSTLECRVIVIREEDGFSAHAADLPGVVSEGDTIDETVENVADALRGAILEYRASGKIPWTKAVIEGELVCEKRILVDL